MSLLLTSDVMVRWYVPASCLDVDIIRYRYWIFNMGKSVLEKIKNGKLFFKEIKVEPSPVRTDSAARSGWWRRALFSWLLHLA